MRFRLFLATKLPTAYFVGLRLHHIDENDCVIKVKHSWFNKNPFKSMYFAVEAMAAEMASGLLAFGYTYKHKPSISMLVVKMEIEFSKKATGVILFSCKQGKEIEEAIQVCKQNNVGQTITTTSIGLNEHKEEVAKFYITWSFKAKTTS
jgi:hypothetical protein